MNHFFFWQRWLFAVAVLIVIFGLLLAFFGQTPMFDLLFNHQINPAFWDSPNVSGDNKIFQGWIYGVLGATVAGWGMFLVFLVHYPFKDRERWAWNCITYGLLVWFMTDTAISLWFRVYFNVLFNLTLFIAGILPILFTRKTFWIVK